MVPTNDPENAFMYRLFESWKNLLHEMAAADPGSEKKAELDKKYNQALPLIAGIVETKYPTVKADLASQAYGILTKQNGEKKMGKELERVHAEYDQKVADLEKRTAEAKFDDERDQLMVERLQLNRWLQKYTEIAKQKEMEYEKSQAESKQFWENMRKEKEAARKAESLRVWLADGGSLEEFEKTWPKIKEQMHIDAVGAYAKGEKPNQVKISL